MSTAIEDVVTSEAFRGDGPLTVAALWVLRCSSDDTYRRAVHGLMRGTLTPEQETAAVAALYELAHELDVIATAARSVA